MQFSAYVSVQANWKFGRKYNMYGKLWNQNPHSKATSPTYIPSPPETAKVCWGGGFSWFNLKKNRATTVVFDTSLNEKLKVLCSICKQALWTCIFYVYTQYTRLKNQENLHKSNTNVVNCVIVLLEGCCV